MRHRKQIAGVLLGICLALTGCSGAPDIPGVPDLSGLPVPGLSEITDQVKEKIGKGAGEEAEDAGEGTDDKAGKDGAGNDGAENDGAEKDGAAEDGSDDSGSNDGDAGTPSGYSVPKIPSIALDNLGLNSRLFGDTFCKAGDVDAKVMAYPTWENGIDKAEQQELTLSFYKNLPGQEEERYWGDVTFVARPGVLSYPVEMSVTWSRGYKEEETSSYPLTVSFVPMGQKGDCFIRLEGDGPAAGEYYSFSRDYDFVGGRTDVLVRLFGKADVAGYSTEELRLLRNSIYAAHGRKFDSEDLNAYFSQKIWYRPVVSTDAFSDRVLSEIERKNAAFIKEMEELAPEERNRLGGTVYEPEKLPDAPYLSYLDIPNMEIGVGADLTQAVDMGAYWKAPGTISHPAALTEEEHERLLRGESVSVCVNEVTGERETVKDLNGDACLLHVKGEQGEYDSDAVLYYSYGSGLYELSVDSDDTVMKPVYEGDIYILKEAVNGGHVSYELACQDQRRILLDEKEWGTWDEVYGNADFYNEKGYFTALYYLGD